ncbi:protein farnesyltransferase/ geranylgeranyltransferase type-1 subunit alpha [Trichoderma asperellum]|uniref:Protein farnesyltransferase/geranylgeranyltransferase type-1 subunit alpha n=1 Tax=Trichoderma asperellum TaxID=101201 RepID=A0A6V8QX93_TRIAP|nr:protein farnesyltransferase/ geranylgeranyltransferase type-1 subunit alpha [Trichoderma asperellum]
MPAKPKATAKAANPEPKGKYQYIHSWLLQTAQYRNHQLTQAPSPAATPPDAPPVTVGERSKQRYYQTNPVERRFEEVGFPGLTPAEKKTYTHARLILPVANRQVSLSNKTDREYWKQVTKEGLPCRRLKNNYNWGTDKHGRDISTYRIEELKKRSLSQAKLTALNVLHQQFLLKREAARSKGAELPQEDIDQEKQRRQEMAVLKRELYGEIPGPLANDPEWDDVIPIPQEESQDALARIAYPDDYAEAVSYLRAVMASEEYSPRCLRLTERVIAMNPGHYTVWLYRFKIVSALKLSVTDEIQWLNDVALDHLKNYQIWHHRQLLLDHHYANTLSSDAEAAKQFAKSETDFISKILSKDTKNYHVWSYRQYLITKLDYWSPFELATTQSMIEDDLRNNSAWSHRFFIVFSDPSISTKGSASTEHDPKVPDAIIDREIAYAQEKIKLAPQNQSSWLYLRGVLAKGGRGLDTVGEFASQFFSNLGAEDEEVTSSHALDLMSEVYHKQGDIEKAKLCLKELSEKWDPVREGYWKYRLSELK